MNETKIISLLPKFDTTFFERYAKIVLVDLLGEKYANLVNRDRPDLQDNEAGIGIEVTRAMVTGRDDAISLITDMAGADDISDSDIERIRRYGYSYGIHRRLMGKVEEEFWSLAIPLKRIIESTGCCAVILEMIQGEGGVMPLTYGFVKGVRQLCDENDMLLIADEVQTGNGRSGRLYSYMNFERPVDVVTTAKGLGGGLPIGACLIGERAEHVFGHGDHGSTFGGNPAVCAGAVSILSRIDDKLLQGVRDRSAIIFDMLNGAKGLEGISGMGLMLGIKVSGDARAICEKCAERGVLALTAKDRVRLLPPLNIDIDDLKTAVGILREEIENAAAK